MRNEELGNGRLPFLRRGNLPIARVSRRGGVAPPAIPQGQSPDRPRFLPPVAAAFKAAMVLPNAKHGLPVERGGGLEGCRYGSRF